MKKTWQLRPGETLFGWLMLAFSLFILVQAYRISGFSSISSPGMFPMMAGAVMVAASAMILWRNRRLPKPDAKGLKDELRQAARYTLNRVFLVYVAIIIAYMLLFEPLGFLASSAAFLFASVVFLKGGGLIRAALISAGSLAVIYVVFHTIFRVVLP